MLAKYLTGIYGGFDREKHRREFRPHFAGSEITCLPDQATAQAVAVEHRERGLLFGVHYPLVRASNATTPLHPLITSREQATRADAILAVEQEAERVKTLGAEYLLLHYPKPSLLLLERDWSDWRMPQSGEAIPATAQALADERELAVAAFAELSRISRQSGLKLVIEHDILHPLHYQELLPELFAAHPHLGFCLDTGRIHMLETTLPDFSAVKFIRLMQPYISNVHLWTVQTGQNKGGGHHPLLPRLTKEAGWGDIPAWLLALSGVKEAFVMFEHRAELVSASELEQCYAFTEQLLGSGSSE